MEDNVLLLLPAFGNYEVNPESLCLWIYLEVPVRLFLVSGLTARYPCNPTLLGFDITQSLVLGYHTVALDESTYHRTSTQRKTNIVEM